MLVICPQERDLHAARSSSAPRSVRRTRSRCWSGRQARAARRAAELPADGVVGDEGPVGAARRACSPSGAGSRGRARRRRSRASTSRRRGPIQQRVAPEVTPRLAAARRAAAVPPAVVGQAGRRPAVAGGAARGHEAELTASPAGRLPRRVRRPRRAPERRRPRVHGRGAVTRRRGHARGLRARGPGDHDRRHGLRQVPGHEQLRALRVSVPARRRAARRAGRVAARLVPRSARRLVLQRRVLRPRRRPDADRGEPALASQFSPLVQAAHGRLDLRRAVPLACGEDPAWEAARRDGVAAQLRRAAFEDAFVEAVPSRRTGSRSSSGPGSAVRAGHERHGELPARDLHRVGRDAGGCGSAVPERAQSLGFELAKVARAR